MAINKRKLQSQAQKHLQKGALAKALQAYETLLEADPHDANSRLKVGDICLRMNNPEDAISAYLKVAKQFMHEGFDAKAVAIYKQIGRIDDKRLEIYEPLAELYQRLGLTSEALNALQTAADAYHKEGRKRDALELLRKMATLDPTNTTSRLKIADLLVHAEMPQDALTEYDEVAEELVRQGASSELIGVYQRILEIEPERAPTLVGLARALIQEGEYERAEPFARRATRADPEAFDAHEVLAQIYSAQQREDLLEAVYRKLAELYRSRGDDEKAREILQRFLAPEDLTLDPSQSGPSLDTSNADFNSDDLALGGSDSLADEFEPATLDALDPSGPTLESDLDRGSAPGPAEDAGSGSEEGAADSEQLFAEASVYLRYGKVERAIGALEAVREADPEHLGVLEMLGDAYSQNGQNERALETWTHAVRVARAAGDEALAEMIRERIERIDPGAANTLGPDGPVADSTSAGPSLDELEMDDVGGVLPETLDDVDLEIDIDSPLLDDPSEVREAATPESPGGAGATVAFGSPHGAPDVTVMQFTAPDSPGSLGGPEDSGVALDADDGAPTDLLETKNETEAKTETASEGESAPQSEAQVQSAPEPGADRGESSSTSSASGTTPAQIAEDLEEADFYFNQGLRDEAEAIFRRVLEAAPNHPQALLRLGEIAEARGEDPGASASGTQSAHEAATPPQPDAASASESTAGAAAEEIEFAAQSQAAPEPAKVPQDSDLAKDPQDLDLAKDSEDPDLAKDSEDPDLAKDPQDPDLDFDIDIDVGEDLDAAPPTESETSEQSEQSGADDSARAAESTESTPVGERSESLENAGADHDAEPSIALAGEASPDDAAMDELFSEQTQDFEIESNDWEVDTSGDAGAPDGHQAPITQPVVLDEASDADTDDSTADFAPAFEPSVPEAAESEASFDLAAELSGVLEADDNEISGAATAGDGFDSIFRAFKQGVQTTVSEGDYETHYDLGIAYREMGLIEDAVGEFQIALGSAQRKLGSLQMLGLCALDLDRAADAVAHFEQALSLPSIPDDQQAALRFDLGRAYEGAGDRVRAREAYLAVAAVDPDFQDVGKRLSALDSDAPGAATTAAPPMETYETFDDVIAEAEAILDDDSEAPGAIDEAPETEADARLPEPEKPKRRRKISFL